MRMAIVRNVVVLTFWKSDNMTSAEYTETKLYSSSRVTITILYIA